jgi:phosphohistidine phosphatase
MKAFLFIAFLFASFFVNPGFGMKNSKILYLVRHAKSSDADSTLTDFDRPLNDRGFKNAPQMGKYLRTVGCHPDVIVSSPSVRTTQTIELIAKEIEFDFSKIIWDETIYRCNQDALLRSINSLPDSVRIAMFVGHNPSITQLANMLQKDTVFDEVPTCGVVAIEFLDPSWQNITKAKSRLLFFKRPENN